MASTTTSTGIDIEYETIGDPDDVPLLLVMGLGAQLIRWPDELCDVFVDRGFFVIRYDNRDVGLSTHFSDVRVDIGAVMAAIGSGEPIESPYQLADMADDAIAVLDALGIDTAHVVGASMGGMIVQQLAIDHPDRLRSVTSIMSTTGEPEVGQPSPAVVAALFRPPARTREEAQEREIESAEIWGSPAHIDPDRLRAIAGRAWDRNVDPHGIARQMAAIMGSGPRAEALRSVNLPFLVVHGDVDQLVTVSGGRRTAELVPNATYVEIEGMGHDLVPALWVQMVEAVIDHTAKADVNR